MGPRKAAEMFLERHPDAASFKAVSYTHLDVYKRQTQKCCPRMGLRNQHPPPIPLRWNSGKTANGATLRDVTDWVSLSIFTSHMNGSFSSSLL